MSAPTLADFRHQARRWLEANTTRLPERGVSPWGEGSDRVSLFRNTTEAEELAQLERAREWQRRKFDAGFGAIDWPVEYGGLGLDSEYARAFAEIEAEYERPMKVEALSISMNLEARTVEHLGTEAQKERWLRSLRRGDEMCCQLFSEPGAGSDLGSISLRAERDGDGWIVNGQKVWTSGAQFADIGYLIARTGEPGEHRQRAFTAFLVSLKAPGVTVRPLKQATGGSTFNEVFFDDVRIPDTDRIAPVGEGWMAMMTTLAFERTGAAEGLGFSVETLVGRLAQTAHHVHRAQDPVVRQHLGRLHARTLIRGWCSTQAAERVRAGGLPGAEGSMLKLDYTRALASASAIAGMLHGPRMIADTGEWGTFAWSEFTTGIAGIRFGGGTDEIQKNTIAERILGLPKEKR